MRKTKDIHESEIILGFKTTQVAETNAKIKSMISTVKVLTSEIGASKKSIGTMKSWSERTDKDARGDIDNRRYVGKGEAITPLGSMSSEQLLSHQKKVWKEENSINKEKQEAVKILNESIKKQGNIIDDTSAKTEKGTKKTKASGDAAKDAAAKHAIMGYALMRVGSAFMEASRKVNAYIQSTIQASLDTGDIMGQVQALLNGSLQETTDRATALREIGKEISVAYAQDFKDIGTATYDAVSAFGDSENTMQKVNAAAMMAKAGYGQTSDAMKLLISTQKSFGRQTMLTDEQIANLTFTTIKLGVTTLPELSKGMQAVSPFATQLGLDIQKTMASIIALAGTTGNTVNVATQLKGAFSQITRGAGSMKKVLDSLGYKDGKELFATNDTITAFKMLNKEAQRLGISMEKLYGRKQATIAGVMLSGTAGEDYNKYLKELYENENSLKEALERVSGGINKSQEAYKVTTAQIEIHKQTIGEKLMPVYAKVLEIVSILVGVISKFSPGMALMIAVSSVVVGLSGFVMQTVGTFGMLTMAIEGSAMAATVFNVAIGGLAGLITLAAVATTILYQKSKQQKDVLKMQSDLQNKLKTETEEYRKEVSKLLETYTRYGDSNEDGITSLNKLLSIYPTLTKEILLQAKAYGILAEVIDYSEKSRIATMSANNARNTIEGIRAFTNSVNLDEIYDKNRNKWNTSDQLNNDRTYRFDIASERANKYIDLVTPNMGLDLLNKNGESIIDIEGIKKSLEETFKTNRNWGGSDVKNMASSAIKQSLLDLLPDLYKKASQGDQDAAVFAKQIKNALSKGAGDADEIINEAWDSILSKIENIKAQNKEGLISDKEKEFRINDVYYNALKDNVGLNTESSLNIISELEKNLNGTSIKDNIKNPIIMALETKISSPFLTAIEQAQQAVDTYKAMAEEFYKLSGGNKVSKDYVNALSFKYLAEQKQVMIDINQLANSRATRLEEIDKRMASIVDTGLVGVDIDTELNSLAKERQQLAANSPAELFVVTTQQSLDRAKKQLELLKESLKIAIANGGSKELIIELKTQIDQANGSSNDNYDMFKKGISMAKSIVAGVKKGMETGDWTGAMDEVADVLNDISKSTQGTITGAITGIAAEILALTSAISNIFTTIGGMIEMKNDKSLEEELKANLVIYTKYWDRLKEINLSGSKEAFSDSIESAFANAKKDLEEASYATVQDTRNMNVFESFGNWLSGNGDNGYTVNIGDPYQEVIDDSFVTMYEDLEKIREDTSFASKKALGKIDEINQKIYEEANMNAAEILLYENTQGGYKSFAESILDSMLDVENPDAFIDNFNNEVMSKIKSGIVNTIMETALFFAETQKVADEIVDRMVANPNANIDDLLLEIKAKSDVAKALYESIIGGTAWEDLTANLTTESLESTATMNTTNNAFSSTRVPDIYLTLTVEGSVIGTAGMAEFTDIMIDKIDERRGLSSNVTVIAS